MSVYGTCNDCIQLSNGTFSTSGSTTPLYIDVVNQNNLDLSNCVIVTTEVIRTYPEMLEYDECGCPIDECEKASLRINIKKNVTQTVDCGYSGFTLDNTGFVLFNLYDGTNTFFINSECCTALGFTPELENRIYVCRWQQPVDVCDNYTPTIIENGYQLFIDPSGNSTNTVPSVECCPIGTIPELTNGGNYLCKSDEVVVVGNCAAYTPASINVNGVVVFTYSGGGETTSINAECCTPYGFSAVTNNGITNCIVTCETYVSASYDVDGYVVFVRPNSTVYSEVPLIECCPINTIAVPTITQDGLNYYKCRNQDYQIEDCQYVISFTVDNDNSGNATAGVIFNGNYCDGLTFNFDGIMLEAPSYTQLINACVDMNSLITSSNVIINIDNNINCDGPIGTKMLSLRSQADSGDGEFACNLSLLNQCYVYTQSGGMVISTGDVVYNYNDTPFNGGNGYYLIQTSISDSGDPSYVCRVDTLGNIQVLTICI